MRIRTPSTSTTTALGITPVRAGNCQRRCSIAAGIWRRRGADAFGTRVRIACLEGLSVLETAIEHALSDNPRSGCPGTFTSEQIARTIAVACEPPEDSARPVTHGTPIALAEEVVARQIVPVVSARHVGRFLKVPDSSPTGVGTG